MILSCSTTLASDPSPTVVASAYRLLGTLVLLQEQREVTWLGTSHGRM